MNGARVTVTVRGAVATAAVVTVVCLSSTRKQAWFLEPRLLVGQLGTGSLPGLDRCTLLGPTAEARALLSGAALQARVHCAGHVHASVRL
jgi:hypothetical protein